MGGAIKFDPRGLPGLKVWFKADTLSLSDGAAVATWSDSSGNGNDATQATAGKRPTFKTAILNGKPVVRFANASATYLATPAFGAALAQPNTIFCVSSAGATLQGVYDGVAAATRNTMFTDSSAPVKMRIGTNASNIITTTDGTPMSIWSAVFNGAGTQLWQNGLSGAAGTIAADSLGGVTLGAVYTTAANLTGDIAEFLVYNSLLTTAQRRSVEAYLGTKYAIVVA